MPLLIALAMSCYAIDGDTLRCGAERIRLLGIDAPEMPGHCRTGRDCAPGDPWRSKATLAAAIQTGPLRVNRIGSDRYGRTLALVYAGRLNLSCYQLRARAAVYKPHWDNGRRLARECP